MEPQTGQLDATVPNAGELISFSFSKTIGAATEGQHVLLIPQVQSYERSI